MGWYLIKPGSACLQPPGGEGAGGEGGQHCFLALTLPPGKWQEG